MDFDHRDPGTKQQAVTRMIGRSGTERILAEVAKFDIVAIGFERSNGGARQVWPAWVRPDVPFATRDCA